MSDITSSDLMNFASSMKEDNGIFGGTGLWFLLILFFLFSGNGFGGNNSQAVTRAEMQDSFNNQNVINSLTNLGTAINTGFDNVQLAMNSGFNGINQNINNLGYQMSQYCCEIKNAVHAEGEETRSLIQANTIQDLRDRVADKDRELLATGLTAAQTIQTNNLENYMRTLLNSPCGCGC